MPHKGTVPSLTGERPEVLCPNPGSLLSAQKPPLAAFEPVLHPSHFTGNLLFLPEGNLNISPHSLSLSASVPLPKVKYKIRRGRVYIM